MAAVFLMDNVARRALRRQRVIRDRTRPLDFMSEEQLLGCYRFRRNDLIYIIQRLEDNLTSNTLRSHAIPAETKILTTLRFLAKGSLYSETGEIVGISKASQSRHIHGVIEEIRQLAPEFIKFPDTVDGLTKLKQDFYGITGFPGVIGAVDGTLIPIVRPTENEEVYVSRKGYHAMNCQGICDSELRFLNFVAKWPGSTHDSYMWNDCAVRQRCIRGEFGENSWLLGDSAYTLRSYLLVPFSEPNGRPQERYNTAHSRTRCSVERAFGVMKSRWRVIHKTGGAVQFTPAKTCRMMQAIAVLHNIAIDRKTPLLVDVDDVDDDANDNAIVNDGAHREGDDVRNALVRARFS